MSRKAPVSRIYGDENRRELLKLLKQASYKRNIWDVFNDFLLCSAVSLANNCTAVSVGKSAEVREEREKRYMEAINKYDKETRMLFPRMFAALVNEMEKWAQGADYRDVLGEVFHELELHNQWKGQFFTPQHISNLMGRIAMDEAAMKKTIDVYGYACMNEPCCGGGAMIYGFMNAFREAGFNPSDHLLVMANDLDERCVWMTYIQCSLYGLPAVVIQQNTLSLETFGEPWYTPVYIWGGWRWREWHKNAVIREEEEVLAMLES